MERPLIASEADRAALATAEKEIRERSDALQMRLTGIENDLKRQFAEAASAQASSRDLDDLEYRFYRDTFRSLPDFDSLKAETVAKLDPPVISIAPATRPDDFGFVFIGTLIVPADGEYEFTIDSDDGSRLILDGNKLLEYDGIHGLGDAKKAKVNLKQGRVPLRLEYFQGQFGKGLQLFWSGPGFKRRSLTAEGAASGADLNELLRSPAAASVSQETIKKYRDIRRELEDVKRRKPWEDYGLCVSEHGTQAPETFVLLRGSPEAEGDKVEPQFLSVLGGGRAEVNPNPAANTTGRRLAFARWVIDEQNRLTSRVFVNRLWQHHFGRGIVRSPNNFGQLGEAPTHPELLDWLASEFMARGWSMKAMHRLILTSAVWQQSSLASADALQKDPVNDLFSRFDLRRLSAEEVRDSVLAVNGRLNRELYGPSIYTKISQEVLAGQSVPGKGWGNSSPEEQARRSIYIHVKRSLLVPMLSSFDFPEPDVSCESRFVTTQPGQALAMLNGDFLNEQAALFADRLRKEAPDGIDAQLRLGLRLAFSREAGDDEIRRSLRCMNACSKSTV
ncbi:MAG UNVERIFIED_CONTAM: DUF1553 domain-containing protein [Planctomycetaceae bacterium]